MKKQVEFKIGALTKTGSSLVAAKRATMDHVAKLLADDGNFQPTVLFFPNNWVVIVYMEMDATFGYTVFFEGGFRTHGQTSNTKREETVRAARLHMAQAATSVRDGVVVTSGLDCLDPSDQVSLRSHLAWLRWQRAYQLVPGDRSMEHERAVSAKAEQLRLEDIGPGPSRPLQTC